MRGKGGVHFYFGPNVWGQYDYVKIIKKKYLKNLFGNFF